MYIHIHIIYNYIYIYIYLLTLDNLVVHLCSPFVQYLPSSEKETY